MGNYVVVGDKSSIRFNADFDGDAMNMFVGRPLVARIEIKRHSSLHNWFIKHASSAPMTGQADDSIIGSFCLTRNGVKLDKYHAMLLFASNTYLPSFTKDTYTGRDIVSMHLKNTPINFTRTPGYYKSDYVGKIDYDPADIKVEIKNGQHLRGVLDKKSVGKGSIGGIYHLISTKYGSQKALEVIYDMQQLAINYLSQFGFTIGINDILVSRESLDEIHQIESSIVDKSRYLTEQLNNGKIIPPVGKTTEQFYEEQQIAILRIMDDFIDPIFKSIDPKTNNLMQLVLSGSKGSINHVYHISSAIGQIVINDKRPKQQFAYKRTLPQFARFETEPDARGFILNSYISGMNSTEFAFNAQNARSDFITKALYTSVTGESERKSIKNLESIIVNNLRMCVKYNNIIQFLYGEDGLDTRKMVKVNIPTVLVSTADLESGWKFGGGAGVAKQRNIFEQEFNRVKQDVADYRKRFLKIERGKFNEPMTNSKLMSVDIERLVRDSIHTYGEQKPSVDEIAEMVVMVEKLCEGIPYVMINEIQEKAKMKIPDYIAAGSWLLILYIRATLNSQRSLRMLNKDMLTEIINKIRLKQAGALCSYGTAVGIIAAMSFSEPLTQYMLDAHHRTTTGGTSKSAMTIVKETLGAKKVEQLSAPSMIAVPLDGNMSEADLHLIANYIEVMKLRAFVRISQIFYEKFGEPVHPKFVQEKGLIQKFVSGNPGVKPPTDLLQWCIRFVLNRSTMIYKNMDLETIVNKLRDTYPDLYFVYSPENAKQIVLRIYIRNMFFKHHVEQDAIENLRETLMDTVVRGVSKIKSASVVKLMRHEEQPDGSIARAKNKFCIETLGTNLADMYKIAALDPYQLQTDAIDEIQKVLGIEAARQRLFTSVQNLGAGGLNSHHVSIYVDEMTYTGVVTSIEKQGLNKRETNNVLLRMGFASPIQTLEEAAINSMEDPVQGITSPLLIGDIPTSIGTAYNTFHINENMVQRNTVRPDDWLDELGI